MLPKVGGILNSILLFLRTFLFRILITHLLITFLHALRRRWDVQEFREIFLGEAVYIGGLQCLSVFVLSARISEVFDDLNTYKSALWRLQENTHTYVTYGGLRVCPRVCLCVCVRLWVCVCVCFGVCVHVCLHIMYVLCEMNCISL